MNNFSLKKILYTFIITLFCINLFAQQGTNNDNRMKIRLGFTSTTNTHKQILVTVDNNATAGIDFGYDAEIFNTNPDDIYWIIDNRKFNIQGIDNIDENSILPIGVHTAIDGDYTIVIDQLQNVPEDREIFLFDKEDNTYYNIKNNTGVSLALNAGDYVNRFELRFINENENTEEEEEENSTTDNTDEEDEDGFGINIDISLGLKAEAGVQIQFLNNSKQISINNPDTAPITSVEIYSFSGKLKAKYNSIGKEEKIVIQTNNLKSGQYILRVNSDVESKSKKILVN
ncbi:putative secreted protein (Por secretion system target) [Lacinutrix venerupis]|uniref:T9SS type A sorting domain-containing protein n=1 Tax=Lacinutrix venerupis TaxID=1486034 RepID=UPI000EAFDD50|nr:T9SS type A sorting domain-containing protein [Lacinutrix venerupis]RLJ62613.1 putative secreted protein (Por secretion system target) [Lacinutrix venerupis]